MTVRHRIVEEPEEVIMEEEVVTDDDDRREVVTRRRRAIDDRSVEPLYRGTQIVWYIFWILEALLVIRFLMRLLGANTEAAFTDFIYNITAPFVAPFVFVFPSAAVDGGVLEWGTLLSLLVYWLVAYAIAQLLVMGRPVDTREARQRLEEQERGVTP